MKLRGMEATPGIEPGYTALQAAASPLRHVANFQEGRRYVAQTGQLVQTFFFWQLYREYLPPIQLQLNLAGWQRIQATCSSLRVTSKL